MRIAMLRSCKLVLALLLMGATNHGAPVGFVNLSQLLARHPLHKMLDAYDREITALQRTQTVSGLDDPAARAQHGAAALARESSVAQGRIERIPASDDGADRAREGAALASVLASLRGADHAMDAYRSELAQETNANARAFGAAMAERNQRALTARRQQLLETELTLGFDLARRDAAKRLMLRLRLADLYLDHATRARLRSELSTIDRREAAAVAAMRRNDEGVLAAYAAQLQAQADGANSAMIAQLRSKAQANLALRLRVLQAESSSASLLPNLPARLDWFASTYRLRTDTAAIRAALRAANTDISRRFAQLAAVDRNSRAQTNAQIEQLKTSRQELYRSMAAQISRDAQRLAARRHLHGVVVAGSRPAGSVDLTGALAAELPRL